MEAGIFQAQDVAVLHAAGNRLGRNLADALIGKRHRPLDHLRQCYGDGLQQVLRIGYLRPAEMREQDHLAALVGDLGDGRRNAFEPGGVGDATLFHGHVEVDAEQHALALYVDVIEGAECLGH